jgi:hypothetical protein
VGLRRLPRHCLWLWQWRHLQQRKQQQRLWWLGKQPQQLQRRRWQHATEQRQVQLEWVTTSRPPTARLGLAVSTMPPPLVGLLLPTQQSLALMLPVPLVMRLAVLVAVLLARVMLSMRLAV